MHLSLSGMCGFDRRVRVHEVFSEMSVRCFGSFIQYFVFHQCYWMKIPQNWVIILNMLLEKPNIFPKHFFQTFFPLSHTNSAGSTPGVNRPELLPKTAGESTPIIDVARLVWVEFAEIQHLSVGLFWYHVFTSNRLVFDVHPSMGGTVPGEFGSPTSSGPGS